MHAKIITFPARSCRFCVQDRCLKAYFWHPVSSGTLQCRVLTAWEETQERLLEQAEQLSLTMEESMVFFAEKMIEQLEPIWFCGQYRVDGTSAGLDCIFLHGHLCIKALPPCTGRCNNFTLRSSDVSEEREYI